MKVILFLIIISFSFCRKGPETNILLRVMEKNKSVIPMSKQAVQSAYNYLYKDHPHQDNIPSSNINLQSNTNPYNSVLV